MFAWAGDGIFPKKVATISQKLHTPVNAILLSGVMASIGILGSFLEDTLLFAFRRGASKTATFKFLFFDWFLLAFDPASVIANDIGVIKRGKNFGFVEHFLEVLVEIIRFIPVEARLDLNEFNSIGVFIEFVSNTVYCWKPSSA